MEGLTTEADKRRADLRTEGECWLAGLASVRRQTMGRFSCGPGSGYTQVFLSEVKASEPRYRLRYVVNVDGTLKGAFDIAPPGRVDEFSPYLTWSARRAP